MERNALTHKLADLHTMPGATFESALAPTEKSASMSAAASSFQSPEGSPSMSPVPSHQNRRMRLKPVRGPESVTDTRFGQGIAFSFNWDPRRFGDVILRQFDLSPAIDQETAKQARTSTLSSHLHMASGVESDSDCDMELLDFGMDDDYSEAPVFPAPKPVEAKRKSSKLARQEAPKVPTTSSKTKPKACVCCGCTSTPLWRDIGKNRPLCNACGIRWKKYGVICESCQYVPCKQERENKTCRRCLAILPVSKRPRPASPSNSS